MSFKPKILPRPGIEKTERCGRIEANGCGWSQVVARLLLDARTTSRLNLGCFPFRDAALLGTKESIGWRGGSKLRIRSIRRIVQKASRDIHFTKRRRIFFNLYCTFCCKFPSTISERSIVWDIPCFTISANLLFQKVRTWFLKTTKVRLMDLFAFSLSTQ